MIELCIADSHSVLLQVESDMPHTCDNPACLQGVGLAADLQLVAAVPVARWVEYITPAPYIEDIVEGNPFALSPTGMLAIPSAPGLGVRWSDAGIEKHTGRRVLPHACSAAVV